jgi:hypothetical protein
MMKLFLPIFVVLLFTGGIFLSAQEVPPMEENECYDGGTLENQCNTEWEWNAGWYLAQYNQGRLSRAEIPEIYRSILSESDSDSSMDNECYEDGTMAGRCNTEWDWNGGWYLARYNQGIFSRNDIPETYHILLPEPVISMAESGGSQNGQPPPPEVPTPPPANCVTYGSIGNLFTFCHQGGNRFITYPPPGSGLTWQYAIRAPGSECPNRLDGSEYDIVRSSVVGSFVQQAADFVLSFGYTRDHRVCAYANFT